MKTAMVLFEGLTMTGLVLLLRELGLPREYTLIYAWFPMLIWEFAGSGHLDSIVMAFLVFAFLFRLRRQPILTGIFFGLAVFTKFYPIVLFPVLYRRGDWKMPRRPRGPLGVALYAPYLSAGKDGLRLPRRLRAGGGHGHRHALLPARPRPASPRSAQPPERRLPRLRRRRPGGDSRSGPGRPAVAIPAAAPTSCCPPPPSRPP